MSEEVSQAQIEAVLESCSTILKWIVEKMLNAMNNKWGVENEMVINGYLSLDGL